MAPKELPALLKLARSLADAQRVMAGKAAEDSTHWHHVLVADVLAALADKLELAA